MSDETFYCSFVSIHYIICECGETFPSEEELKTHLEHGHGNIKTEKREYRCYLCSSSFDTEEDCIRHYESSHIVVQGEHNYVETYTNETVEAVDVKVEELPLEDIEQSVVQEKKSTIKPKSVKKTKPQRNIVCEVCGKRYASNAALRYHQRVHTGEKPYKCTFCPKTFSMPLFLQIHHRTHTGERPYVCSQCPKAFSNKAALLRHDRVHTGIKPYECPQCGKFFTQSNSMKLHVNTVHLKQPAPYKSKNRKRATTQQQFIREAILKAIEIDDEHKIAIQSIKTENDQDLILVKPEIELYQEEEQIMMENVGEIAYEVVYEEQ